MKKNCRFFGKMATVVALCLSMSVVAFAEGGNGSGGGKGDGSGGGNGQNAPLVLEECSIEDGQKDVPTDCKIMLSFSKNVAELSVREQNEKAISLKSSNGENATYELIFPEEFDSRRNIEISATLEPQTSYVLSIDQTLVAKNGVNTLDKVYEINFTTEDAPANIQEAEAGSNTAVIAIIAVVVVVGIVVVIALSKKKKQD